jgi:MFS family permease
VNPAQRRITFAICLSVGLTFLVSAGLTFLIEPMSEDLHLGDASVEAILAIPSIASLIVIFIAGQTGDRLGHRRTLLLFSVLFVIGSALVAVAQEGLAIAVGLALCGAAATAIQIVALGLLQESVPDGPAHVSAFTTYGMVYPLAFLFFPVLTAGLLDVAAWRLIPIIWAAAGVVIAVVVSLVVTRSDHRQPLGEWLTPLLAGVVLAAGVRFLDSIGSQGPLTPITLIGFLILAIALIAFGLRYRMVTVSSFSFTPVRGVLMRVLLLGVALVALVGTLTYVILALEYMYGMSPLHAAIAVIPAQAGAVLGAKIIAGHAIRHWGISRAGRHATLALAISMLPLVAMQASTPAWYLIACATLFNTVALAAVTILNTDVMSRAPQGHSGPVSSFRGAASSIGTGLGVVVLGTSVITAVNMSAGSTNVNGDQVQQLAAGLRLDGILGFAVALIAWLALLLVNRRSAPAI